MATLINGNGNCPVTAQQDADLYQGIFGGSHVKMLPVGNEMAYTIADANTITLSDGECIDSEGRRIHIDVGNTDSFTIPTGTSGQTAYYIIGYILAEDSDGNETASTFVEEVDSADSTLEEASLRDGASSKYVSLYRVTQESLSISDVTALFEASTPLSNISEVIDDTLPFSLSITNATYGYLDTSGEFHPFRNPTGDAEAADVLAGKVFSSADEEDAVGTMTDKQGTTSTATPTLDTDNSYLQMQVPARGCYSAASYLRAAYSTIRTLIGLTAARIASGISILGLTGTYTDDATATAAGIISGKTAYVAGSKLTGTLSSAIAITVKGSYDSGSTSNGPKSASFTASFTLNPQTLAVSSTSCSITASGNFYHCTQETTLTYTSTWSTTPTVSVS